MVHTYLPPFLAVNYILKFITFQYIYFIFYISLI
nr:MAG TPA: hypothetical protein [Caudoviricetes sp.]